MSRNRRVLNRLAGVLTMAWIWSRPGLLLPGVLALPSSGCFCDCSGEFNTLHASSSTPMTTLDVSGDGCGATACVSAAPDAGGACHEFTVKLVQAGSCHLTGTAADGRQSSTDVTVGVRRTDCCGNIYTTGRNDFVGLGSDDVNLTFSSAGSAGSTGSDGGPSGSDGGA
jgi:hypothetical protein